MLFKSSAGYVKLFTIAVHVTFLALFLKSTSMRLTFYIKGLTFYMYIPTALDITPALDFTFFSEFKKNINRVHLNLQRQSYIIGVGLYLFSIVQNICTQDLKSAAPDFNLVTATRSKYQLYVFF